MFRYCFNFASLWVWMMFHSIIFTRNLSLWTSPPSTLSDCSRLQQLRVESAVYASLCTGTCLSILLCMSKSVDMSGLGPYNDRRVVERVQRCLALVWGQALFCAEVLFGLSILFHGVRSKPHCASFALWSISCGAVYAAICAAVSCAFFRRFLRLIRYGHRTAMQDKAL
jgi:hypothetical protein